jgi:hypothetical protein
MDSGSEELARAAQQVAARLTARGITLDGGESPGELVQLEEAVEAFEAAVASRGGDLMVDEAPRGQRTQPDDVHFGLPNRSTAMTVSDYLAHLADATDVVRRHHAHD